MHETRLKAHVGFVSMCGKRENNEDFVAAFGSASDMEPPKKCTRGILAAIADGMGGHKGGREAAELTVREFIEGYYTGSETLGVERTAQHALQAINNWIFSQGRQDPQLLNMATTFSCLILRGRQAHIIHIGDTRIYRLRDQLLEQLTDDHTFDHPDFRHVLHRGVGFEKKLYADFMVCDLRQHDRFLLCSDGVHGVLSDKRLQARLAERCASQESAQRIVAAALAAGSTDNVTALVMDVVTLPSADRTAIEMAADALAIEDPPKPGAEIDGFRIVRKLCEGRYSILFIAEDLQEQHTVVLKFPQPRANMEATYRQAFIRELWVSARAHSPWVVDIIELPGKRQTQLYCVMPFYQGETLTERLNRRPKVTLEEGVDIGIQLAKAVYALNRRRIIHRDIKPDNVILLAEGGLKLLDLGVAHLPEVEDVFPEGAPGTPSYMAPELFEGQCGDELSEVYALGVSLYQVFTGRYLYGEVEPFSRPRFTKRKALGHYRPDLPAWLDAILAKATDLDAQKRFEDAMEIAFELEAGMTHGRKKIIDKRPLIERNPVLFWQGLCALLLLALLVMQIK